MGQIQNAHASLNKITCLNKCHFLNKETDTNLLYLERVHMHLCYLRLFEMEVRPVAFHMWLPVRFCVGVILLFLALRCLEIN